MRRKHAKMEALGRMQLLAAIMSTSLLLCMSRTTCWAMTNYVTVIYVKQSNHSGEKQNIHRIFTGACSVPIFSSNAVSVF